MIERIQAYIVYHLWWLYSRVPLRLRMSNVKLGPGLKPLKPKSNVIFVTCKKITAELGAKAEEE